MVCPTCRPRPGRRVAFDAIVHNAISCCDNNRGPRLRGSATAASSSECCTSLLGEGDLYTCPPAYFPPPGRGLSKRALTRGSRGLLLNVSCEKRAGLGSNSPLPQFNK